MQFPSLSGSEMEKIASSREHLLDVGRIRVESEAEKEGRAVVHVINNPSNVLISEANRIYTQVDNSDSQDSRNFVCEFDFECCACRECRWRQTV